MHGNALVVIVLLFFLGNIRSACIVAVTIPLSLLCASIFAGFKKHPCQSSLSGCPRFWNDRRRSGRDDREHLSATRREKKEREKEDKREADSDSRLSKLILAASREVERPIVYAIVIIILAYLPIFTLQRIEGRLFSPMAWTVAFALLGSLLLALTIVPVLASFILKGELKEWRNPVMPWLEKHYRGTLEWTLANRRIVVGASLASFALTLYLAFGGPIGSEFLPHLDEGNIWLRGTMPPSTSFETASGLVKQTRKILMGFSEVPDGGLPGGTAG